VVAANGADANSTITASLAIELKAIVLCLVEIIRTLHSHNEAHFLLLSDCKGVSSSKSSAVTICFLAGWQYTKEDGFHDLEEWLIQSLIECQRGLYNE
jgi:hypothetical protein